MAARKHPDIRDVSTIEEDCPNHVRDLVIGVSMFELDFWAQNLFCVL